MSLIVDSLSIPCRIPHPKAIESFGDNHNAYKPEFWEVNYQAYRYLRNLTNQSLCERYVAIHRNLKALSTSDREIIPVQSFLSSWYWYKKEHQTRLEFALRNLVLPVIPKSVLSSKPVITPDYRPQSPNRADVLYRYGDASHLELMLYEGSIRLSPAGSYLNPNLGPVRSDDELNKHSYSPGEYIKIIKLDGSESPVIGDLKRTKTTSEYYTLCMSCDWDMELFEDFNANACVVIHDTNEFAARLKKSAESVIGDLFHYHNPVEYFDAAMSKDFRFAYQREYRYIWESIEGQLTSDFKYLNLGSIEDIATIYKA